MSSLILENYLESIQKDHNDITYEMYCYLLSDTVHLDENIINYIKNMRLTREWVTIFRHLKNELNKIAKDFKQALKLPKLLFNHKLHACPPLRY